MRTYDAYLKADGEKMPALKKLTITEEKVWSTNAGRTLSAKYVGDIVAIKKKLQCEFVPGSFEDSKKISDVCKLPFVTLEFLSTDGQKGSGTFYSGTPTFPFYTYLGNVKFNGITVNFIEQ